MDHHPTTIPSRGSTVILHMWLVRLLLHSKTDQRNLPNTFRPIDDKKSKVVNQTPCATVVSI